TDLNIKPITKFDINDKLQIIKINSGQGAIRNLLSLGIRVGSVVIIKKKSNLRGPMLLNVDGSDIAIGYRLSEKILAEKV
ncbi:MAG: ferrous iron transport protein A, partial [Ignavibacteriales bacterium]|nr:ferrous iron transport protein A [Ignavibacteriales bacterium]